MFTSQQHFMLNNHYKRFQGEVNTVEITISKDGNCNIKILCITFIQNMIVWCNTWQCSIFGFSTFTTFLLFLTSMSDNLSIFLRHIWMPHQEWWLSFFLVISLRLQRTKSATSNEHIYLHLQAEFFFSILHSAKISFMIIKTTLLC